ncbi:hypothetical protein [Bacillus sp. ISL-18]
MGLWNTHLFSWFAVN